MSMFKGKKISLVLPAYNEEKNIINAIEDFQKLKIIDEIIVVDNNSKDKTAELARKKGAIVIKEIQQGYGYAIRRGLKEALGDYIILSEPDGTFAALDTLRLLSYIDHYDMVTGTRTNPRYFTKNANMGPFLRFGNIFVAKVMQKLYGLPAISDCGCTFRILKKQLASKLLPKFAVGGQHFLSELVVLTSLEKGTIYEMPVHYRERIGASKITGSFKTSLKVGIRMLVVILSYKFGLKI